jgi:hypothetical protein
MLRFLTPLLLLPGIVAAFAAGDPAELHGPDVHPGYPDVFNLEYMIDQDSISPDHNFAVVHGTRAALEESLGMLQDFLVTLHPFHILGLIEAAYPYAEGENHSGMEVTWSADSSTALVQIDGKWGPRSEHLIELRNSRIARQTDLVAEVHKLLMPDYRKSKAGRYNDLFDFILETDNGGGFTLEKNGRVRISSEATTDPKGVEANRWNAKVEAVWDVAQAKFLTQKVTRESINK